MNKLKKILYFVSYWPWIVDFIVVIISAIILIVFICITIKDFNLAALLSDIIAFLLLPYSIYNFLLKRNNVKIEFNNLFDSSNYLINDCQNILLKHHPNLINNFDLITEKVLRSCFEQWKQFNNIKIIESKIIYNYVLEFCTMHNLSEEQYLFLEYRILTSSYNMHLPQFLQKNKNANYYDLNSTHNKFLIEIYKFINQLNNDINITLEENEIKELLEIVFMERNSYIEMLLKEKEKKDRIQFLLNKCFENAYTNIGNLELKLSNDAERNLFFLFKYDERFAIYKRKWRSRIKENLGNLYSTENEISDAYEKEKNELDKLIYPQPFSKAINDFKHSITQIGKDKFSYIINPDHFEVDAYGWTPEKYIEKKVIPRAKLYLDEFNKKLQKKYKFLKKDIKKTLDANYYIFFFNRNHFSYYADQESIPTAIKRFIIKSIIESEKASDYITSQMLYIKQVINNITLSGLLFTKPSDIQNDILKLEKKILSKARKNNIILNNIYEIRSIGNQKDDLVKIIYNEYYKVELKRKSGKKYDFIVEIVDTIIANSNNIIDIFTEMTHGK